MDAIICGQSHMDMFDQSLWYVKFWTFSSSSEHPKFSQISIHLEKICEMYVAVPWENFSIYLLAYRHLEVQRIVSVWISYS